MKNSFLKITPLLFFFLTFLACDNDDDSSDTNSALVNELIGDWQLISSQIDGVDVVPKAFNCKKKSELNFTKEDYKIDYINVDADSFICSGKTVLSGTYNVTNDDKIEITSTQISLKLIDGKLHVISKVIDSSSSVEKEQVDIFEKGASELPDLITEENRPIQNEFVGKWSIMQSKLNGTDVASSIYECKKNSTIEFKSDKKFSLELGKHISETNTTTGGGTLTNPCISKTTTTGTVYVFEEFLNPKLRSEWEFKIVNGKLHFTDNSDSKNIRLHIFEK